MVMININKKINILDTTLRDGSYAINFSFSASDTSIICSQLEDAGIEYIEIGHGVGLNASNVGYGEAAETDETYMKAASQVLKKAKYGMFCIPGIAQLKDVDLAGEYQMDFIRIGTNVNQVEQGEKFIAKAKKYNMFVCANFMKSYAMAPTDFATKVELAHQFGADMVYVVDSSGGMFSHAIRDYYHAIRDISDIPLGFHGHNNLSFALSNSLEAIQVGYDFVDSSLQGLGRSSGNTSTEELIAALLKLGYSVDIDFLKILNIGFTYINPLITSKGKHPLDIACGFADFHSSYMNIIHKYASKYAVDPVLLIIESSKYDKTDVNEEMIDQFAKNAKKDQLLYIGKYHFNRYIGREQDETIRLSRKKNDAF